MKLFVRYKYFPMIFAFPLCIEYSLPLFSDCNYAAKNSNIIQDANIVPQHAKSCHIVILNYT